MDFRKVTLIYINFIKKLSLDYQGQLPEHIVKCLATAFLLEGGRYSLASSTIWSAEDLSFPPGFKFGVASSSYQIEGGWNVSGTYDFYAMNFYTSRSVRKVFSGEELLPWPMYDCPDIGAKMVKPKNWPVSEGINWFWVYPEGIRRQLIWLKKNYGDLEIMILENGYATKSGLDNTSRVDYYRDHLKQILLAIKEDGVNVTRYTAWTLMDNFEWVAGYQTKFGLFEVDFSSPNRTRFPRASAEFYAKVIKSHSIPMIIRDEF